MKEWACAARTTSTSSGMSAARIRRARPSASTGTPAARAAFASWSSSSSAITERSCPFSAKSRNICAPNQRDPISAILILPPRPEPRRRRRIFIGSSAFLGCGRSRGQVRKRRCRGSTAYAIPPRPGGPLPLVSGPRSTRGLPKRDHGGNRMRSVLYALAAGFALAGGSAASAQVTLKASHQFPGGKGDPRDEMVQIIAREAKAANVGLDAQVYPGASLFKPNEQWNALVNGQLDISSFPLDYASGKVRAFGATLMPGLVRNHERAQRLNQSPFMKDIKDRITKAGVIVLADAWLAGAVASKRGCIRKPEDMKGLKIRSAGATFAEMWQQAGASIVSV